MFVVVAVAAATLYVNDAEEEREIDEKSIRCCYRLCFLLHRGENERLHFG